MTQNELERILKEKTEEEIISLGREYLSTTLGIPIYNIPAIRQVFSTGLMLLGIPMVELYDEAALEKYEKADGYRVCYTYPTGLPRFLREGPKGRPSILCYKTKNYIIYL